MVKLLAAFIFLVWMILVLAGIRGFVHLLLLVGTTVTVMELAYYLRSKLSERHPES